MFCIVCLSAAATVPPVGAPEVGIWQRPVNAGWQQLA